MAERLTALAGQRSIVDVGAGIHIAEMCPATIAQIDAWPGRESAVVAAVRIGGDKPQGVRDVSHTGSDTTIARLTPERWLLISDHPELPVLADEDASVFDLSHARSCLRITGADVEQVLAKGAVLDFSVSGFPVDTVAQTMAHHMDLTIIRRSETIFDILVFRGFAESLLEHLLDAAGEFGVSFRPFVQPS